MQGTQRYVIIAYLGLAFFFAMALSRFLGFVTFNVGVPDPALLGPNFTVTSLLGFAVGLGGTFYLYRHPAVSGYSDEVVAELQKVTWPSKQETQNATTVVIVTTIVMAFIIFIFDWVWNALTGVIYQ